MLALADQKGKSLEQTHIFALAHILRRPIIVYGVKVVKNFRGENLGFANFEGKWMCLTQCKSYYMFISKLLQYSLMDILP